LNIYAVGGAIRDAVMGIPVNDIDYVVVGSSAEEMIALGYQPVGKDFPVFLHPQTHAEYALARTERKTGVGYQGFHFYADPSVTLEQDLQRRDLTINAMAQRVDDAGARVGPIIDPYGGQNDIEAKVFRHVSAAFAEDPLRLLRIARFAARFPTFTIAPETQEALKAIVKSGELSALSLERVWQELGRGMGSADPLRMVEVLLETGAADQFLPQQLIAVCKNPQLKKQLATNLDSLVAKKIADVDLVCAVLLADLSEDAIRQWSETIRMPHGTRDFAELFSALKKRVTQQVCSAVDILAWFNRADAWRKPERAEKLIALASVLNLQVEQISSALAAALAIDSQAVIQSLSRAEQQQGERIRSAIDAARLQAVEAVTTT
jgi:tRNA nucleotidyltransferase (CCA-adding enzyme)